MRGCHSRLTTTRCAFCGVRRPIVHLCLLVTDRSLRERQNLLERLFRRGYRRLKTGPSALLYSSNSTQEPTSSADKRLDLAAGWAILLSAGGFSRRWIS